MVGIYEPSINSMIKNPALSIFNHLPLKRLRANSPAPCDFGEFGAPGVRPGEACWFYLGWGDSKGLTGRLGAGSVREWNTRPLPLACRVTGSGDPDLRPGGESGRWGHATWNSPSSEEKEAEVSIALWKFSSIFRPSSMFEPSRGDLYRRGRDAPGVRARWTQRPAVAALLGEHGGSVRGDQNEPGG